MAQVGDIIKYKMLYNRRNLHCWQIDVSSARALYILLILSLVSVETVCAVEEKWPHKSSISKSEHFHARPKRNANWVQNEYMSEYYANYYNDYYSNYYNHIKNMYNNNAADDTAPPTRKTSIGFVGSSNDNLSHQDASTAHDTSKYTYTPIFKYKSTHRKRHKLFVPV